MFLLAALVVANDGNGPKCQIRTPAAYHHFTSEPANGEIIDVGTNVTFTCDPGYVNTVSANHSDDINVFYQYKKACDHNDPDNIDIDFGAWANEFNCQYYRCNFETVENAHVQYFHLYFNESAFYYCNEGFSYNGTERGSVETTICGADGPSSHNNTQYVSPSTNFSCEPTVCGVNQSISHTSSVENVNYGDTVTFTCTEGYTLPDGSTTYTDTCSPGLYQPVTELPNFPSEGCREVSCYVTFPDNSYFYYGGDYSNPNPYNHLSYNETVEYECMPGFVPQPNITRMLSNPCTFQSVGPSDSTFRCVVPTVAEEPESTDDSDDTAVIVGSISGAVALGGIVWAVRRYRLTAASFNVDVTASWL